VREGNAARRLGLRLGTVVRLTTGRTGKKSHR
jgi:hypothetical protein